jgi:hypothetical protein
MERTFNYWQAFISSMLLCMTGLSFSVRAAPPVLKTLQSNHAASMDGLKSAVPGTGAPSGDITPPRHLDLRLPVGESTAYSPMMEARRFAAARGMTASSEEAAGAYAPIAGGTQHARIMGNVEAFAQRFRHEGLPVARLWENHAAMVSLGLNGKGKPGIWLVQKTH